MSSLIFVSVLVCLVLALAHPNTTRETVPRIVGGQTADIKDYPYIASISVDRSLCGGSLISAAYVLTAATCINFNFIPEHHTVRVGSNSIYRGGFIRAGRNTISYDQYFFSDVVNNIGLIEIDPVAFGFTVQPIDLPSNYHYIEENAWGTILGFGKRSNGENAKIPGLLMKADVPHFNFEICKNRLQNAYGDTLNPEMNVCFRDLYNGRGICNGDIGSPLVVEGYLMGIAGAMERDRCDGFRSPSVFTKVTHYRAWIETKTGL